MNIKLRARLSAYSKINSVSTLVPVVNEDDIDTLFKDVPADTVVDKDDIDSLFKNEPTSEPVTKEEIDSLFGEQDTTSSVTKDEIDGLFSKTEASTVGVVSHADIDSLFK